MSETTSSLTPIISEEEFLPLVIDRSGRFLSVLSVCTDEEMTLNKNYFFTLTQEAEKLEEFLDDHGARSNLRWLLFSELVASVRNFAIAGFHLNHILERYSDYLGSGSDTLRGDFINKIGENLDYFGQTLSIFYHAIRNEAHLSGARGPEESSQQEWTMVVAPKLPYTIRGESSGNERERIVSVAQGYRKVFKEFRQARLGRKLKVKTIQEMVPGFINETMMAQVESILHNLQSEYDTYIRGGELEKENKLAGQLRGLVAIPMHLFETLRWLTHFYERHESDMRKSEVKANIAGLLDDDKLFDCMTSFGLKYCSRYLEEGNKVAERLLSSFVEPATVILPVPKPQGFHARPSTYVSLIVQEHGTDVFMVSEGERFDCRSVLELISVGAMLADSGAEEVTFEGDQRVLDDLTILANCNYCEDENIPRELGYLRIMRNL